MIERNVSINLEKRGTYLSALERRFREWHQSEWSLSHPSYEYFRDNIANASFLAYIGYIVEAASPEGKTDLNVLEQSLRERLGEYFSQEKLEKAIAFVQEEQWEYL